MAEQQGAYSKDCGLILRGEFTANAIKLSDLHGRTGQAKVFIVSKS